MNAYDITGARIADDYAARMTGGAYSYQGEALDVTRHSYDELPGITYGAHDKSSYTYRQDAAVSGGVLFQAITGSNELEDMMATYDHATGEFIATFSCPIAHGSAMDFSDEKYADSDEFPLLYCTVESPTILVRVLRVTRTSGTLVRTLKLVDEDLVWNIVVSVDRENHRMITSWNKGGHYGDISIGICHVITVWDLDSLTPTGNTDEYKPKMLDQFEVPFIFCQQGCCYLNGIMYILSSGDATWRQQYSGHTAWIYCLDPNARRFVAVLKDFTTATAEAENEAIVPRFNAESGRYDLEMIPLRGSSAVVRVW